MMKKLATLALLVIFGLLLYQVPAFKEYADGLKADLLKKKDNVTAEVERVKGQVEAAKKTAIDLKDKAVATKNAVETTVTKVNEAVDSVGKVINAVTPQEAPAEKPLEEKQAE